MPNVLSLRDLVSRPDNRDETVLHTFFLLNAFTSLKATNFIFLFVSSIQNACFLSLLFKIARAAIMLLVSHLINVCFNYS